MLNFKINEDKQVEYKHLMILIYILNKLLIIQSIIHYNQI